MNQRLIPLALCCALSLSACGGGGGSPGNTNNPGAPAPVSTLSTITATNATDIAAAAYAGTTAVSESSSALSSILTGVSVGGANIGVVTPALRLIRNAYPRAKAQLLTGVTMTEACSGGGSLTIEANLRNEQMASNGDTITMTANNCVEDGDTANGKLSTTLSNVSGDVFNSWNWAATMDTTLTDFAITSSGETVSVNGDMKIALTQTNSTTSALVLSGKALRTTVKRNGVTVDTFTLADYSMTGSTRGTTVTSAASFAMSGSASGLGQFSFTVKNLQPFVSTGGAMPTSGSLVVNGAASSVTLTVASTSGVRLDVSAKGDGAIAQTNTLSWMAFLAAF